MKTPHQLAEENMTLSHEYSIYSGELAKLTQEEGNFYKRERPQHKSDTSVARAFQTSDEGIKMTVVKLKLKSLEKQMGANKLMIEVCTNEAKGIY